MNGAQYLLTLNVGQMMQLVNDWSPSPLAVAPSSSPVKAWQSSFWNFAWVDYVVSYRQRTAPHLDTSNPDLWKAAGLPLCEDKGLIIPDSLRSTSNFSLEPMTETLASRTLIWIVLKTLSYIASSENVSERPRRENDVPSHIVHGSDSPGLSINKDCWDLIQTLLKRWKKALPPTFEPCFAIQSNGRRSVQWGPITFPSDIFEVFYSNPMSATASLLCHFVQILLILHQPAEMSITASASPSATRRLQSQRQLYDQIDQHVQKICAIALSQSTLSVRMHMAHPLHLAGLCVTTGEHRQLLVDLLVGIQQDTGYSTEWAVAQLKLEWGWEEKYQPELEVGRFM